MSKELSLAIREYIFTGSEKALRSFGEGRQYLLEEKKRIRKIVPWQERVWPAKAGRVFAHKIDCEILKCFFGESKA